jgi:hypothetical protein
VTTGAQAPHGPPPISISAAPVDQQSGADHIATPSSASVNAPPLQR